MKVIDWLVCAVILLLIPAFVLGFAELIRMFLHLARFAD